MTKKIQVFIEIQENWLKVVWGADTSSGFEVTASFVQSIEKFSNANISKELVKILSKLKVKLAKTDATVVLSRHMVAVRYLLLPAHADEEIRQMVDLQIFKHIPYAKGEVVIDYQIVSKESSGYSKVMVFVVEREVALRLWNICNSAGAWVSRMTPSSLGILFWPTQISAPALELTDLAATFVVDHDVTELCVSSSGKLVFSRSFRVGEDGLKSQQVQEWMQQVELSFRQYRNEQFSDLPKRFLVIAPQSLCVMLMDALKQAYNVPVDAAVNHPDIFKRKGLKAPELIPYLASVGGAAIKWKSSVLNLIPAEAKTAKLNKDSRIHGIRITVLSVFLLCTAFFALNIINVKRNWYLANLNGEVKKTQVRLKALQPKVQLIESVDKYLAGRLIVADILAELSSVLPPTTSLTMFSINNGRNIVMQGMSQRASEVSLFQKGLLSSGKFGDVNLDYTNKTTTVQGEVSVFQITCQMIKEKK